MDFKCGYCDEVIHSVAAIHHGEFVHHRCSEAFKKEKETLEEEILTEE